MYEKSIELLNRAVADELSAVHQYMYFHFHCDDQGYDLLAGLFKRTAIEEMVHIERIAERILYLKSDVVLHASSEVQARHVGIPTFSLREKVLRSRRRSAQRTLPQGGFGWCPWSESADRRFHLESSAFASRKPLSPGICRSYCGTRE